MTTLPPLRLFRWLGAKSHLVPLLAPVLQSGLDGGGRLISLFYGTGSLEQTADQLVEQIAAEANPDLRAFYRAVARSPGGVAIKLYELDRDTPRTAAGFSTVRAMPADRLGDLTRAARFLWLSAFAFNGIWRVNRAGGFNVPADPDRLQRAWPLPYPQRLAELELLSELVRKVRFLDDWRQALQHARPGDMVVSDPPYLGGFVSYTASRFSAGDQQDLARALGVAAAAGISVLAFNSPEARPLYRWAPHITTVRRSGRVSSAGGRRGPVKEFFAISPLPISTAARCPRNALALMLEVAAATMELAP